MVIYSLISYFSFLKFEFQWFILLMLNKSIEQKIQRTKKLLFLFCYDAGQTIINFDRETHEITISTGHLL